MAQTNLITAGVKMIKIAKNDSNGINYSPQLRQSDVIRIKFNDLGTQEFVVVDISEKATCFLYFVEPVNFGYQSSTLNTPTALESGGSGFIDADGNINVLNYPNPTGRLKQFSIYSEKTSWTFNQGTGQWSGSASWINPFALIVSFTGSCYNNGTGGTTTRLSVYASGSKLGYYPQKLITLTNNSGSSNAQPFSGSFTVVAPSGSATEFGIRLANYYGSNTIYVATQSLYFDVKTYVTSSTDLNGVETVIEPFNDGNFYNSNYNALIDNAVEARINDFFMDVDYSSDANIAVNEAQILDGTATRATVQNSNYTSLRSTLPRYLGSKNSSPGVNIPVSGGVPAVESDGTYFAYFDWVGGTTPEVIDKAGFHIKYLIDANSKVYTPNLTSSYYYNLINSFNENQNVNVLFQADGTSGNVDTLQGVKPVIKSGALGRAVIFSQTGSDPGVYLATMSFAGGSNPGIPGFATNTVLNSDNFLENVTYTLDIASVTDNGTDMNVSTAGDYMNPTTTDNNVFITPKVSLTINFEDSDTTLGAYCTLIMEKSTDSGTTWTQNSTHQFNVPHHIPSDPPSTYTLTGNAEPAVSGTRYRVRFFYESIGGGIGVNFDLVSGTFNMTQNPNLLTEAYYRSTAPIKNYWTTGSSSSQILTGSQFTTTLYGLTQDPESGAGYDTPYLPFVVKRGDEFRFNADENLVYQVISVNEPGSNADNKLYITLNKALPTGINIDSFLLRRYNPNPNFVIVNALKDSTVGGGSGFLLPEFASDDITNRFDEIIKNLTEKGLI